MSRHQLLIPDVDGTLPLFMKIPFTVKVITTTAKLRRTRGDKQQNDKEIFPTPCFEFPFFQFCLKREMVLRAKGETKHIHAAGQDGWDFRKLKMPKASREKSKREWRDETQEGDKEEVGRWVQTWTYKSTMKLDVPPTFSSDLVDCSVRCDFGSFVHAGTTS